MTEAEIQVVVPPPSARPGRVRRTAAGAWHVAAGLGFLLRHARLWPAAALPVLVGGVLALGGLFVGVFALGVTERVLAPGPGRLPGWLSLSVTLGLWATTMLASLVASLAVTLLVTAPFLDRLARRSGLRGGEETEPPGSLRWDLSESFRGPLWFAGSLPLVVGAGLVPVAGPLLGLVLGASVLGWQSLETALTRCGLEASERRNWHREWRWESLGLGLAGLVALLVPGINALVAPALALGATCLLDEIGQLAAE